jgi:hypothetical protein
LEERPFAELTTIQNHDKLQGTLIESEFPDQREALEKPHSCQRSVF